MHIPLIITDGTVIWLVEKNSCDICLRYDRNWIAAFWERANRARDDRYQIYLQRSICKRASTTTVSVFGFHLQSIMRNRSIVLISSLVQRWKWKSNKTFSSQDLIDHSSTTYQMHHILFKLPFIEMDKNYAKNMSIELLFF